MNLNFPIEWILLFQNFFLSFSVHSVFFSPCIVLKNTLLCSFIRSVSYFSIFFYMYVFRIQINVVFSFIYNLSDTFYVWKNVWSWIICLSYISLLKSQKIFEKKCRKLKNIQSFSRCSRLLIKSDFLST